LYRTLTVGGQGQKKDPANALHGYGNTLSDIGRHEDALSVRQEAVSLYRTLNVDGQVEKRVLLMLSTIMEPLSNMDRHEDALSVEQEAISLYRTLNVNGQVEKKGLADALHNYGIRLSIMGRHEDALSAEQEAVSLTRG